MLASPDIAEILGTTLPGDVASLDAAGAAEALARVKSVRSYLDAYEARVTSHLERLHRDGASEPPADLHTRHGGVSAKEARAKERRAEALEQAPHLAEALADGRATAGHVDALADATSRLDDTTRAELFAHEEALAHDATRLPPEEFGRSCRDLIRLIERDQGVEHDRRQRRETRLTKHVDRDGMYVLHARMHPELGHAVFATIAAETARLVAEGGDRSVDRARVAADALGGLTTAAHQAVRPREAEIRLLVDVAILLDGLHGHSVSELDDGTPLPPSSVRRLVCNGRIVPILVDTDGVVLDAGRDRQLADRHQRRALRAMYRTCAFEGCDVPFPRCEIHHLEPFELGGPTDLANLLPLCSRHHHVIHEPGWDLTLAADRTLTIRGPGGPHRSVPLRRRPAGSDPPAAPQSTVE